MSPGFFFHCPGDSKDLSMFYVSVEMSQALYQRFGSGVDPLVRILHKPSFEKQLALFHQNGACSTYGLGEGFEALIFSVYFSAVISMKNDDVLGLFGVDRAAIIERFTFAIAQALANARFLQSEELMPLQACVIFNVRQSLRLPPCWLFLVECKQAIDRASRYRCVCAVRQIHGHH